MTYFLKKKKWMAWVVLLTFLFTSFIPTNLPAGNSVAEAATWNGSAYVNVQTERNTNNDGSRSLVVRVVNSQGTQLEENTMRFDKNPNKTSVNAKDGYQITNITVTGADDGEGDQSSGATYNKELKIERNRTATMTITIATAAAREYRVTFNSNGGSGTVPAAQSGERGTIITLPSGDGLNRSKYTFMGWGKTSTSGGANASDKTIYPAGYKWPIERNQTLYAVWGTSEDAYYFVRLDGQIPTEPGSYAASAYTDDDTSMHGTVKYNTFYADSVNGVNSHLGTIPSTTAIRNACNAKVGSIKFGDGSSYITCNSDTEFEANYYVLWYVVKQNTIHVDGVLLKKSLYNVKYDPNAVDYTGNVPMGGQYAENVTVTVGESNLTRTGYTFGGWQSDYDSKTYNAGGTFTMPAKNVVLKAIWIPKDDTQYKVQYLYETDDGSFRQIASRPEAQRTGRTGNSAEVTADDKTPNNNTHYFDATNADNVLEGTIAADGSLVLRVYFKKKTPITITAGDNSKTYDGIALTQTSYTVKYGGKDYSLGANNNSITLDNGDVVYASTSGSRIDAGPASNSIVTSGTGAVTIMRGNEKVTDQYTITYGTGTLTVNPRPVTLTSATASKVYDGDPLTNNGVAVTGDGFVEGEGATYDVTGAQTNVGSSDNTFTYELIEGTNADNYEITVEFGTLTVTRNEDALYQVVYHYQNPQTGAYDLFETFELRSTTAGSLAFIEQEDTVTTRSMYQFNAEKTETQKTVHIYPNDEQGNPQYTTLNVYFDALYNVVYRYTDGETSYDVARSGYVYHYGDSVVAPGMASVDQFDGRWYKNADGNTDEWVFDDETIEKNIGLVNADNTIYLYTTAKVTPLNDNTIRIRKTAVNGTEGAEYGFNLKLIVDPTFETDPLTGEAADELQKYNSAMITARGQYDSAKGALEEAVSDFEGSMFMTTNSALTFVMYGPSMNDIDNHEIRPAVYGLTTGSFYEFQSYNLFEDSFDVVYADDVDNDVQKNIVKAIKRMAGLTEDDEMEVMSLRDAYQPFAPNALLHELVSLNTSGSALAFDFDAAQDLYVAAENLIGKRAAYQDARDNLDDYMAEVGRYAVVTVTVDGESTKYVLNGTDEAGNKLFTPDESGKYILSFDFNLTSGAFKDFTVTATTGSTIQFIITETDDGGAVSTTVNGSTGHSVTGMMTTGSALEYTFVNNFNSGDGEDPWTPTDPEDPRDPRDPQDPIDIEDPDVPLAEPDVDEPDIEIEDPDVPLTDVPGDLVEIDEPEVPLGDAPRTGDSSNAIPFVVLMMGAGIGLAITRRKFN